MKTIEDTLKDCLASIEFGNAQTGQPNYPDSSYILNGYTNGAGVKLLDRTFRKDRMGFETRYEYNGLRQLTRVTDALTNVTAYGPGPGE